MWWNVLTRSFSKIAINVTNIPITFWSVYAECWKLDEHIIQISKSEYAWSEKARKSDRPMTFDEFGTF